MASRAGQIIPRGPRTWLVRVFLGRDPETGRRKYLNHTVHGTKKDAQAHLNTKLRERDLGIFIEPDKSSLNSYLDTWLETAAKPKLRGPTHDDYCAVLRRYVRPRIGDRPLAALTPLDIQRVYKDMLDSGLAPRTVRYAHAILHSALHQAVKWRLLSQNPADQVELPRQQRKEIQVLDPDQAVRFADTC